MAQLLEMLGEGNMVQVFKARHVHLGRVAALKLIRKERLANSQSFTGLLPVPGADLSPR